MHKISNMPSSKTRGCATNTFVNYWFIWSITHCHPWNFTLKQNIKECFIILLNGRLKPSDGIALRRVSAWAFKKTFFTQPRIRPNLIYPRNTNIYMTLGHTVEFFCTSDVKQGFKITLNTCNVSFVSTFPTPSPFLSLAYFLTGPYGILSLLDTLLLLNKMYLVYIANVL